MGSREKVKETMRYIRAITSEMSTADYESYVEQLKDEIELSAELWDWCTPDE